MKSSTGRISRKIALSLATAGALAATAIAAPPVSATAAPPSPWFQSGWNQSRTGNNPLESRLPAGKVRHLHQRWSVDTGDPGTDAPQTTSAVSANGMAYMVGGGGDIRAVRVSTGQPVWSAQGPECGAAQSGPALHLGVLVVPMHECSPDDALGYLAGYDAQTGRQLWALPSRGGAVGTPVTFGGRAFAVATTAGRTLTLQAVDVKTGKVLWRKRLGAQKLALAASSHSLLISDASKLSALDPATGKAQWTRSAPGGSVVVSAGHIIDVGAVGQYAQITAFSETGTQQWSVDTYQDASLWVSATSSEIITAGRNGLVQAWSLATGSATWITEFQTGITSQPTIANGVVYLTVSAPRGQAVYAIVDGSGSVLWHYLDNSGYEEEVAASSVADGTLFVSLGSGVLRAFRP